MAEMHPDIGSRLDAIAGVTVERAASAASYCTYRVGGEFELFVRVDATTAIAEVISVLADFDSETLPVGKGSNLLVADGGFGGVALLLGEEFAAIDFDRQTMHCGAGASLPVAARASVAAGLSGFEWAVGVPGSIGGAVRMNAGGHGSDMAASLVSVEIADLKTGTIYEAAADQLDLGYRRSRLTGSQLVIGATLELDAQHDSEAGAAELKEIVSWRRANQPGGANAGSVFTNPPGDSAGRLIDAAGLKGLRVGSAVVSDKHANFIQADSGGRADDVMALMVEIVDRVHEKSGVRLHAETRLVGFDQKLVEHVQATTSSGGD